LNGRPESPGNGPDAAGAHETRVLLVVGLGAFLSSVSTSIVGVILPRIGAWAGLGVVEVQWTMLVPLIVISVGLLPVGRAGDLAGHRRVYLAGLALVGVAGLACAAAPSYGWFLAARGIQGLGSAALMATSPALVSILARPGRRGRALGIVSTATYLGLTAGPPLGGFLEHLGGWRLVFAAQVPLAAVLLAVTVPWMPDVGARPSGRRVDWPGVALLAVGLTALLLALGRQDGGVAATGLALGAFGVAGLAAFLGWQRRARSPLLDLRLFVDRTFASASVGALLNYLAVFHATFLMPFYLEDLLGMSPGRAGIVLTAMPLIMAITASPSGHLSDRWGSRWLSSAGLGATAVALAGLGLLPATAPLPVLVGLLCLLGLGAGVFVSPNTNALMSSAPADRQGTAAGVMALARNLGMLGGTSMSAALYAAGQSSGLALGQDPVAAGMDGLHLAFRVGAGLALAGALVVLVRPRRG
jgi:EmrB/QacA subfamily drug resistance transporter